MPILPPNNRRELEQKSSVDQYEDFLGVSKQQKVIPLVYDVLESASCRNLKTHKAMLCLNDNWNGFFYPIANCQKEYEEALSTDKQGLVKKPLTCHYGKGEYEEYVDQEVVTEADNTLIGAHNKVSFRVGLNYYQAKTNARPVKKGRAFEK